MSYKLKCKNQLTAAEFEMIFDIVFGTELFHGV